jgi:putative acetyltransferase
MLIGELDRELARHYPPEQRHGLNLDAIFQPHIRFFVARLDGLAAGCGGVALFADFAEVKRMYVREAARGQGVADAILRQLTEAVLDAGLPLLRLETGTEQGAALRFYRRSGFRPCEAFEPYASMPAGAVVTSVFMEMPLV